MKLPPCLLFLNYLKIGLSRPPTLTSVPTQMNLKNTPLTECKEEMHSRNFNYPPGTAKENLPPKQPNRFR